MGSVASKGQKHFKQRVGGMLEGVSSHCPAWAQTRLGLGVAEQHGRAHVLLGPTPASRLQQVSIHTKNKGPNCFPSLGWGCLFLLLVGLGLHLLLALILGERPMGFHPGGTSLSLDPQQP